MRTSGLAALIAALLLLGGANASDGPQNAPGPQGPEEGPERHQVWLLPLPGERLLMRAAVLRPPGDGPFPLVVINHGSNQSSFLRGTLTPSDYRIVAQWFLGRGFVVVLPVRPGHGATGGPYFEDQGRCESPDYQKAGLATADSIQAAIDYMTAQPFVQKSDVVVIGQSAGGWGALALASRNPKGVSAIINFAGGRGGRADDQPDHNCAPERLVAAATEFGRTARIPTLWLYSENDSYFAPALSKRMYDAFRSGRSDAEYHLLPPVGADGHLLIDSDASVALWAPLVEQFLAQKIGAKFRATAIPKKHN